MIQVNLYAEPSPRTAIARVGTTLLAWLPPLSYIYRLAKEASRVGKEVKETKLPKWTKKLPRWMEWTPAVGPWAILPTPSWSRKIRWPHADLAPRRLLKAWEWPPCRHARPAAALFHHVFPYSAIISPVPQCALSGRQMKTMLTSMSYAVVSSWCLHSYVSERTDKQADEQTRRRRTAFLGGAKGIRCTVKHHDERVYRATMMLG